MYQWEIDYTESLNYNLVCRLETALWNLGIPTAENDVVGDFDWTSSEVRRYSRAHGLSIGNKKVPY